MDNAIFKNFVIKQICGEWKFSNEENRFHMVMRTISPIIRSVIQEEGEKWGLSKDETNAFIAKVQENINLAYKPHIKSHQWIDVSKDLKTGSILTLSCKDEHKGEESIRLLFLGISRLSHLPRFMVLYSSRWALHAEDIVEPTDNSLWAVNYPLLLSVRRAGKPFPNKEKKYLTYKVYNLSTISPSPIHEVLDSKKTFSFQEEQMRILSEDCDVSFGKNPISLLMHNYSNQFKRYVDFNADGVADCNDFKLFLEEGTTRLSKVIKK